MKRICEDVGLECNEDGFFNLLGTVADMSLSLFLEDMKSLGEVSKAKKVSLLSTAEVRKSLEDQGVFMMPSKIIPEMGISEDSHPTFSFDRN